MPIKGALLFAAILGSLPVCFIRPFYGLLVWTVIAFLNPQSSLFYWSAASSFPWAVAVAIPTLSGLFLFGRGWSDRLASREVFLIVALWLWFTLTTVASTNTTLFVHHAADSWASWRLVSKILVMTVAAICLVDSLARLRIFVWVMAGCFGLYALKSIPFIILTGGAFRLYGPAASMIADNNDFGLALNMTWPMFFFLAQTEPKRWVRRLSGLFFLVTIMAVLFTYSRGALLGLVAVLGMMFLRSKRGLLLVPVVAFVLVIALLFAPAAWRDRMDPTRPDAVDESAKSRLNSWSFSWNLAMDYPIAGGGFATFTPELFQRYAPNVADTHGPHSIYFQVLAEHGFVGLLLYLTLLVASFGTLRRLLKRARSHDDPVVANYANMFRFSMVGFLVSGAFLGRAYFDYFFAVIACIVILGKVCHTEWADQDAMEWTPEAEEQMA